MQFLILIIFSLVLFLDCRSGRKNIEISENKVQEILFFPTIDNPFPKKYLKSFPVSNEIRIDLFRESIEDVGGSYIGVGTDQNFSFAAWANSDYVFLMDFDRLAIYINRVHIFFFSISPSFEEYKDLWAVKNRKNTYRLLKERFGKEADFKYYEYAFNRGMSSGKISQRFRDYDYMTRRFNLESIHNSPKYYNRIHNLAKKNRIYSVPGSLLGNHTMESIATAIHDLNSSLNVIYFSNAEDYFQYGDDFNRNILIQPIGKKGYVIRTAQMKMQPAGGNPIAKDYAEDEFHYNVQSLSGFKKYLAGGIKNNFEMLRERKRISKGFSGF